MTNERMIYVLRVSARSQLLDPCATVKLEGCFDFDFELGECWHCGHRWVGIEEGFDKQAG